MKNYLIKYDDKTSFTLNKLAREQMKIQLLKDIRIDIEICKLENWDYKVFLLELKEIIDSFLKKAKENRDRI